MDSQGKALQHALDVVIPVRNILALLCATDCIGHQEDGNRAVRVLLGECDRQSQAIVAAFATVGGVVQDEDSGVHGPFTRRARGGDPRTRPCQFRPVQSAL